MWIIASSTPGIRQLFFVALDAMNKPTWTDHREMAKTFPSRAEAERFSESVDGGELEMVEV